MSKFGYYKAPSPSRFSMFPPVIKNLLMINVAVFFAQILLGGVMIVEGTLDYYFMKYFALQPTGDSPYFVDGGWSPIYWIWQVLSYQFMHGGFMHLFFNMFALWMFGMELETRWGSRKFLTYYLLSGIGAALVQIAIGSGPTVGASGAIYGILLAFGMSFPERQIFMFPLFIPIKAKYFVFIFAGIELFSGVAGANDGVAHFAHLGGAATGFLLLRFGDEIGIFKMFDKLFDNFGTGSSTSSYNTFSSKSYEDSYDYGGTKVHKMYTTKETSTPSTSTKSYNVDGEEITQQKIDAILDKISASGYQNLTEREKKILNELSKKI